MGHKFTECEIVNSDLPSFLIQMVLFLNAGLVLDAAFKEFCLCNAFSDRFLYKKIRDLYKESSAENIPIQNLIYLYARDIKCKELVRVSLILMNHHLRGSNLADKLESEIAYLNKESSFSAKAKTKEAETKLCFPLVLILIALIAICTAPALLNI